VSKCPTMGQINPYKPQKHPKKQLKTAKEQLKIDP
jgi:hypothetical protein